MNRRLGLLVERLVAARDRRPPGSEWAARMDDVLAALRADRGGLPESEPDEAGDLRLDPLRRVFGLTALDVELLVVAAAPELDANIGIAFALLQGDPSRHRAGMGLALELAGGSASVAQDRARLASSAPLRRHELVQILGDEPFPLRALRVPDRVVAHLVGDDALDALLVPLAVEPVVAELEEGAAVARALSARVPLVWVRSGAGGAGLAVAATAFESLGVAQLVIDLRRVPAGRPLDEIVRTAVREAGLLRAGLVVVGADRLVESDPGLLHALESAAVPVVAVARRSWDPTWLHRTPYVVEAPVTGADLRAALWRERLPAYAEGGSDDRRELVSLRLAPEEILQTARYAAVLATARDEPLTVATAKDAARRLSADMSGARKGRSTATFDDLVLPDQVLGSLRELVAWSRHRDDVLGQGPLAGKGDKGRGITALFSGSPGTGKTLAAHVVAAELGLDLHTVELSSIVDKYIGETEKNLERVFTEAESLNVLLFFDEADALFGSRSEVRDARDRYANQEVAYLLQRMEQFDGIAVLATNLRGNLDVAFSRRLHFVVHFPDPDVPTRRRLWAAHIDALAETDPVDAIDVDHLAETVEVAGGDIRNIVLAAAYTAAAEEAPVGMRHLTAAVVREYRKLGRRLPVPGLRLPVSADG